jgi:ferrochelatase
MAGKRVRRAIGLILSSFQAEASWRRYQDDVAEARLRVGPLAPEIEYASPWFDREGFIEAMAERVKEALGQIPPADRPGARLIFTAHSIPTAMAEVSPYASQFVLASRLTASRVGHAEWSIAYQSRSGSPRESWLEPDIAKVIRECAREGARHVVAAPIGYVEILYDLDVEARRVAETSGVSFLRAAAVNDHPAFICMLRDLVVRASEN